MLVDRECADTEGWTDDNGNTCSDYEKDGSIKIDKYKGSEYNFPEYNCCISGKGKQNFMDYYQMSSYSHYEQSVKMIYFAFTTLSKVGLGDFNLLHATDMEIVYVIFMLIIGIITFTYIMSQLIQMLTRENDYN